MLATAVRYQLSAALLFLTALILIHPSVEAGMNDDWSFIRTAYDLAQTGHLHYNGWSAPLIGIQAYWGALFIKLFGFSFLAVRASVWVMTLGAVPVLWSLFRHAGLNEPQAFFGLVTFLLSPLNLPNLSTFMTDMPAFLLFATALLCVLKAWNAVRDRDCLLWMSVAAICSILSGSIRQIYWFSGICFLAVLAIARVRRPRGRAVVLVWIGITAAIALASSHWLAQQPYVPAETTLQDLHELSIQEMTQSASEYLSRYFMSLLLLSLPFSFLFVVRAARRLPLWLQPLILLCAVAVTREMPQPLPWLGNTLTQTGVLLTHTVSAGEKPVLLSATTILLLGSLAVAAFFYAGIGVYFQQKEATGRTTHAGFIRVAALTLPFLLAYLGVVAVRATEFGLYDRYLIPAVFLLETLALSGSIGNPGKISWTAACVFAVYAVLTTHDYFAEARAKLEATQQILRSGQKRDVILSGFEFDCWTQTEISGHINNELVTFPGGAYHNADDCNGPEDIQMWWRSLVPDVKARYVVSLTPLKDLAAAAFPPVEYWRWLPLERSRIYVQQILPPEAALSCKAAPEN